MSDDAVSLIQDRLRSVAAAYGYPHARISLFPTLIIVALREGEPATVRTIDSVRQLRLDQASEVIAVARRAERAELAPAEALAKLREILASRPRFGPTAYIASHGVLTIGLGLVIHPAAVELWVYAALGILVGAMKTLGAAARGHRLPARRRRRRRGLRDRVPQPGRRRSRLAAADDPAAGHLPAGRAADHGDRRPRDGRDDHGRQSLRRRTAAAGAPRDRHRRRRRARRRPQLRPDRGQRRHARLRGRRGSASRSSASASTSTTAPRSDHWAGCSSCSSRPGPGNSPASASSTRR